MSLNIKGIVVLKNIDTNTCQYKTHIKWLSYANRKYASQFSFSIRKIEKY